MNTIDLFNIPTYKIDTSLYKNILHDDVVSKFEEKFAEFVGAKYCVCVNSATNAIFLSLKCFENDIQDKDITVPIMIPPVVVNAVSTANKKFFYIDNIDWIGGMYTLYDGRFKIIDSAQYVEKNQYTKCANNDDLMIFSFYPTKPISGIDGGAIVSNSKDKIDYIRILCYNGMINYIDNSWSREHVKYGYKMYMNSIQADVCLRNLSKYDKKCDLLKYINGCYDEYFSDIKTGCLNSKHLYRILVKNKDLFIKNMSNHGINCGYHYKPMAFGEKSKSIENRCVSIPFHEKLNKNQVNYIIKYVKKYKNI